MRTTNVELVFIIVWKEEDGFIFCPEAENRRAYDSVSLSMQTHSVICRKKKARTSMTMILRRQTLRRHGRAMAAASRGPGPRGVQGCTHSTVS
eukprot:scaffold66419_cov23-Tisochrysis_lutea.AAC.2